MKFSLITSLLSFLLFIGCSNKKQISEFESILGKEKSETLTSLIFEFENEYLKTYYSDLDIEKAYIAFLYDVRNSELNYWQRIGENLKSKFKENQLNIDIYQIPDSVWVEKTQDITNKDSIEQFAIRRKYLDSMGTIKYGFSSMPVNFNRHLTKDTILGRTRTFSMINLDGRYSKALETISKESDFLVDYVDRRRVAGKIAPGILINLMADYKVDVKDYFIKRIIVVDVLF